jgi:hypothetical protein
MSTTSHPAEVQTNLHFLPNLVQNFWCNCIDRSSDPLLKVIDISDFFTVNSYFNITPQIKVQRGKVRRAWRASLPPITTYPTLRKIFIQEVPNDLGVVRWCANLLEDKIFVLNLRKNIELQHVKVVKPI